MIEKEGGVLQEKEKKELDFAGPANFPVANRKKGIS